MLTRVLNLMAAGGMTLLSMPAIFEHVKGINWGAIIFYILVCIWLAGAIGLCFNKKLGWVISLTVAWVIFILSLWLFIGGFSIMDRATDPTDGIGYMIVFALFGLMFSTVLTFGLFRIRKSCFYKPDQCP